MEKKEFGFDFKFTHTSSDGEILWQSDWEPNQMADEGFELMFDVFFRGATAPTSFAIGLTASAPLRNDDIAAITGKEISGTNYGREGVTKDATGFPTLEYDGSDMAITTKEVEFHHNGSSGDWDTATNAFISAVMAGTDIFMCWKVLNNPRTLHPGDKLRVEIKQKGTIA